MNKVYNIDCLELMKTMEDNSVDSIVTDPPYGLSKEPDIIDVLSKWINNEPYIHNSSGFMAHDWDSFIPGPEYWKECLRVLKPGGHLLAFGGTRTFDLISIALRIAGFERRDTIFWCYGSGFPKSLNISKQIDKMYGAEREVVGKIRGRTATKGGRFDDDNYIWQPEFDITAPSTSEAKQFSDFGTALKPAFEPILLCRKPLEKGLTVAENCIKWGTGGINIEGCRIAHVTVNGGNLADNSHLRDNINGGNGGHVISTESERRVVIPNQLGRFPSNLILSDDPEVQQEFAKYGKTKSGKVKSDKTGYNDGSIFINGVSNQDNQHGDEGSVARFFYCAKADKTDRNEGLDDFIPSKQINTTGKGLGNTLPSCPIHNKGLPSGSTKYLCGCDQSFSTTQDSRKIEYKNTHSTVKPTSLMQYMCRLITPPNGIIFDPFAGSGSTGKASILEGFRFIGAELGVEHTDIANARIQHAIENKEELVKKYSKQVDKILPKPVEEPKIENKFF